LEKPERCMICGVAIDGDEYCICEDDFIWFLRARKFIYEEYGSIDLSNVTLTADDWDTLVDGDDIIKRR